MKHSTDQFEFYLARGEGGAEKNTTERNKQNYGFNLAKINGQSPYITKHFAPHAEGTCVKFLEGVKNEFRSMQKQQQSLFWVPRNISQIVRPAS